MVPERVHVALHCEYDTQRDEERRGQDEQDERDLEETTVPLLARSKLYHVVLHILCLSFWCLLPFSVSLSFFLLSLALCVEYIGSFLEFVVCFLFLLVCSLVLLLL